MSKDDDKPHSDSDLDRNDELLHPIRKIQDKSKPITEKDRIDRIQECLDEGSHVNNHDDTHKKINKQLTVAQRSATSIEVASSSDGRPSTSRDNASSANELPLTNIGQTLKRQSTVSIEYDKDSKQRQYDLPDVNPQQTSGFDGYEKYTASGSNQSFHGNIHQSKLIMPLSNYTAQEDHGSNREIKMEAAVQFVDLTPRPIMDSVRRAIVYQNQLLLLFLYRGLRNGYTFRIAKDVDDVGKFDDLSFQYRDETEDKIVHWFLQVKYKSDESKMIRASDLLHVRSGDFSLQEYSRSFREIKKKLDWHKNQVKDCIIWTNAGFDFESLRAREIRVERVASREDFLDFETTSKKSARYKLLVYQRSQIYKILEETSDEQLLAQTLAECVCKRDKIRRHSGIFASYHIALAMEILDVENRRFSVKFCRNCETLSRNAKNFRKIFGAKYFKYAQLNQENISEDRMWEIIGEKILQIDKTFGERSINIDYESANQKEFFEAFVELLKSADNENLVKIDRKNKVIADNIHMLVGPVIEAKCENIYKFRSQFLFKDYRRRPKPRNIAELQHLLMAHLGNKYNHLDRYRLEIDHFPKFELPDSENLEAEIYEFLDKLVFAVNQPNEVELEDIITRELAVDSQFESYNAKLVYNLLLEDVVKGLKYNGKFLTNEDGKAIFHSVEGKLNSMKCSGLSLSYLAEISRYDVEFEDEIRKLIKFLIPDSDHEANQSVLNLIAVEETLLTVIRVYQTIRKIEEYNKDNSRVFVSLEMLRNPEIEKTVVRGFQLPQTPTLLVVECGSADKEDLQRLCDNLQIEKNSSKKLILITKCADIQSNEHVKVCVEKRDEVSFNNLTEGSQQKLLDRKVFNFQEEMAMSLRELLENRSSDKNKSSKLTDFGSLIDSSTLVKLIRSEEMRVGDGLKELGEVTGSYINRKCHHQVFLGKDILKCQLESEVFAISGTNLQELRGSLAMDLEKIRSFGEIDRQTVHLYKFVILDNEHDRQQFSLCAEYLSDGYNVHWLKSESEKLIWKESHGDITNLLKYREVDKSPASCLTDDQLAGKSEGNDIVIISDDAGMGKTTMFRFLARKIKADTPGLWVINIDMNSFPKVQQDEFSCRNFNGSDIDQAIDFFVEKLSNLKTDLEKKVLKIMMKNQGRVALLFDGFDEIGPNYQKTVIQLLQTFKKHGIEKLFVSTRPHKTEELEKSLITFHYTMNPFSKEDQMNFFIQFWQARSDLHDVEIRVKQYVEALIEMVRKSIRDIANEFSGIPLQTRMIAEAFLRNTDGEMRDFETCEEFLRSERRKPKLPKKMRIVDLYKHFVDRKHHIYYTEKVGANSRIGILYELGLTKIFLKTHQKLALYSLFNTEELNILLGRQSTKSLREQTRKIAEDTAQTGIISYISDDKPQFIHRSFAEYFTAIFMVKKLKKVDHNPSVQKFIVDQILLQPQYNVIRAFLNGLLENSSLHDDQYEGEACANGLWKSALEEGCGPRNQTIFHVAVRERNDEIIKFFLPRFGNKNETSELLNKFKDNSGETALYAAATCQHWEQLKLLVESGGADVNCWNCNRETPLHRAAFSGSQTMVEWLVENGADLKAKSIENHTPLHSAARSGNLEVLEWLINETGVPVDSLLHDMGISEAPLAVFQWLVEEKDASHEARDDSRESLIYKAVLWRRVDVVEWLVTNKGVALEHEPDGGTKLIRLAIDGNHWDLVKCLVRSEAFNLVAKDTIGSAVLECAIGRAPLNDIEWLVDHKGIDVNAKITNEDTFVHYSVKHQRLDVVEWLVTRKLVDLTTTDATGRTVLHKAAVGGSLDMIQFLIQTGKVNVFHIDNDNRRALDVYIEQRGRSYDPRIQQLLSQNA